MSPFAIVALQKIGWRLRAGSLCFFRARASGPAYHVFPLMSLAPLVTVALSAILLGERAHRVATGGALARGHPSIVDLCAGFGRARAGLRVGLVGALAALGDVGRSGVPLESFGRFPRRGELFFYSRFRPLRQLIAR